MKKNYKNLLVWQLAIDIAPKIYRLIRKLPKEETFALGMQLRRAVISVPSNIAEGQAREYQKEFLQYLSIAKGSLAEVHTQLIIAQKLGYLTVEEIEHIEMEIGQVARLLHGLIHKLEAPYCKSRTSTN